jgi:hypothetical protein
LKISSPGTNPGRALVSRDLRYIKGVGAASFIDLPADGANATRSAACFSIEETASPAARWRSTASAR